jgi:hypothetical protein
VGLEVAGTSYLFMSISEARPEEEFNGYGMEYVVKKRTDA